MIYNIFRGQPARGRRRKADRRAQELSLVIASALLIGLSLRARDADAHDRLAFALGMNVRQTHLRSMRPMRLTPLSAIHSRWRVESMRHVADDRAPVGIGDDFHVLGRRIEHAPSCPDVPR